VSSKRNKYQEKRKKREKERMSGEGRKKMVAAESSEILVSTTVGIATD
jgi:hypothetical protein